MKIAISGNCEQRKLRRVVYDVDDTLWDLTGMLCDNFGVNKEDHITYDPKDNPRLSDNEKQMFYEAFRDPEVFKQCRFFDGYEQIFDLEKDGSAEVWISSANLNESIMEVKRERLRNEIPNINMEHVSLTVAGTVHQGRVPGYILVDDSLSNVANSDFEYYILIDMPHNRNTDILEMYPNKNIIKVHSLKDAIKLVEDFIRNDFDTCLNKESDIIQKLYEAYEKVRTTPAMKLAVNSRNKEKLVEMGADPSYITAYNIMKDDDIIIVNGLEGPWIKLMPEELDFTLEKKQVFMMICQYLNIVEFTRKRNTNIKRKIRKREGENDERF